jgi:hypothetical protein
LQLLAWRASALTLKFPLDWVIESISPRVGVSDPAYPHGMLACGDTEATLPVRLCPAPCIASARRLVGASSGRGHSSSRMRFGLSPCTARRHCAYRVSQYFRSFCPSDRFSHVTRHSTEVEQEHYEDILDLLFQLSEEAKRRLRLADAAMREIWTRGHGHDAERREGVSHGTHERTGGRGSR